MTIAIVEDEQKLADTLKAGFVSEGCNVDLYSNGVVALEGLLANEQKYGLVIMDLMLPGRSGFEVCRELRTRGFVVPILILTARNTIEDKVMALDSGADDFMLKPFAFEELLARMRALLRRSREFVQDKKKIGPVEIDEAKMEVYRDGKKIALTLREYELLIYLVNNKNKVVDRDELFSQVWEMDDLALSNVVDVHIRNLRKKIDDPYIKKLIHTVRGVGYTIQE